MYLFTSRAVRRSLALVGLVLFAGGASPAAAETAPPTAAPDAVIAWNENAGKAAIAACIAPIDNPLHESRLYAMTHVAVHDALNAIDRRYKPYALDLRVPRSASPSAAVAAASHDVLVALLAELPEQVPAACRDAGIASVEADYAAALDAMSEPAAGVAQGVRAGRAAAAAILAVRSADGSDTPLVVGADAFVQGTLPGEWRFTPGRPFAFAPGWGSVTPFVLRDSAQFRPAPPYAITGRRYATDLNEIKRLGGDDVTTPSARTPDQTEIANFWLESSPLAWNRIARTVSSGRGLGLWEQARLFGLLNTALADGYIGSFDTKFHYRTWRPVTAIREAGADGNPRTTGDPTWTPLITTAPIPDYDSAHAVEGAVAAAVMRRFFATDDIAFDACSRTLAAGSQCTDDAPVTRRFDSFSEAAAENGESRILVGFHVRNAVEAGLEHGRRIGERAVRRLLRPVDER